MVIMTMIATIKDVVLCAACGVGDSGVYGYDPHFVRADDDTDRAGPATRRTRSPSSSSPATRIAPSNRKWEQQQHQQAHQRTPEKPKGPPGRKQVSVQPNNWMLWNDLSLWNYTPSAPSPSVPPSPLAPPPIPRVICIPQCGREGFGYKDDNDDDDDDGLLGLEFVTEVQLNDEEKEAEKDDKETEAHEKDDDPKLPVTRKDTLKDPRADVSAVTDQKGTKCFVWPSNRTTSSCSYSASYSHPLHNKVEYLDNDDDGLESKLLFENCDGSSYSSAPRLRPSGDEKGICGDFNSNKAGEKIWLELESAPATHRNPPTGTGKAGNGNPFGSVHVTAPSAAEQLWSPEHSAIAAWAYSPATSMAAAASSSSETKKTHKKDHSQGTLITQASTCMTSPSLF